MVKRACTTDRPGLHELVVSKGKGAYTATVYTAAELEKSVREAREAAAAAKCSKAEIDKAEAEVLSQAYVPQAEEYATLKAAVEWIERSTSAPANPTGPKGRRKAGAGLHPTLCNQITLMLGNSARCAEFDEWHGDDDGCPSAAVAMGVAPAPFVPPYFVRIPRPGQETGGQASIGGQRVADASAARYHAAREQRWREVLKHYRGRGGE
eukprot:6908789-Prymnesium_polylepis.1